MVPNKSPNTRRKWPIQVLSGNDQPNLRHIHHCLVIQEDRKLQLPIKEILETAGSWLLQQLLLRNPKELRLSLETHITMKKELSKRTSGLAVIRLVYLSMTGFPL